VTGPDVTGAISPDAIGADDDQVAAFQIDGQPFRGRIARLAMGSIDPILRRHAYPRPVALLLGEALTFAVLLGASLKVEAKLTVQAEGDGPVSLLIAEYTSTGALRGYARLNPEKLAAADLDGRHALAPRDLIGKGVMAVTVDQGPDTQPYQGFAPLDGETLSDCAAAFLEQSEQVASRVRLAVGELVALGVSPQWRAGGALIQKIAGDAARGQTDEEWNRASILFDSVRSDELADPDLSAGRILFRLFHEDGVRVEKAIAVRDACSCSKERLVTTLSRFPEQELHELADEHGSLEAGCQFCGRRYPIRLSEVLG